MSRQSFCLLGFNYKADAPAYKFNISATSFGFGDPDLLSAGTDILAITSIFGLFSTAHAQKLL